MKKILLPFILFCNSLFGQCGSYNSTRPITYSRAHDITISNVMMANNAGDCLYLLNCQNITIVDSRFGPAIGIGVHVENCTNITIKRCFINSVSTGVYVINSTGIKVDSNQIKNVMGPMPRGQAVQFNAVYGSGNSISGNKIENLPGLSFPEDAISLYKSYGAPASPILVQGNWIRGGGPSVNGGGIMTGDNGGSYMIVKNNILVNPGQYGIAIGGGSNIQLLNNTVFAKKSEIANVGVYVWNQATASCSNTTIAGNLINWANSSGSKNPSWNAGNCGEIAGWNTNTWDAPVDSTALPAMIITRY